MPRPLKRAARFVEIQGELWNTYQRLSDKVQDGLSRPNGQEPTWWAAEADELATDLRKLFIRAKNLADKVEIYDAARGVPLGRGA